MDDDDLDLEPMTAGRSRPIIVAVLVIAASAGIAIAFNRSFKSSRRTDALLETSTAWNRLSRCLVGEAPAAGERPSTRVRRTELAVPSSLRNMPAPARLREWPYRCATFASVMTHALFEAGSEDPQHRLLAVLASRAATALDDGELRTGAHDRLTYIDEIFEVARRASLPPAPAATNALPPEPAHPLLPRNMTPLFASSDAPTIVATDPVPSRTLRVILGQNDRRLCTLRGLASAAASLASGRCTGLAFARSPLLLDVLAADDDAPAFVRVKRTGSTTGDVYGTSGPATPAYTRVLSGYALDDRRVTVASEAEDASPQIARILPSGPPQSTPLVYPIADNARVLGPVIARDRMFVIGTPLTATPHAAVVRAGATASVDAGAPASDAARTDAGGDAASSVVTPGAHLFEATITADDRPIATFTDLGSVPPLDANPSLLACRTERMLALAVRGAGNRVAVRFLTGTTWSAPVETTASPAVFTCHGDEATFTWTETATTRLIRQAHCTAAGCREAHGPLPDMDGDPLVTDLDGRILAIASPRPGLGLRMRLAPLGEVHRVDDVVVIDDAEHGGLAVIPPTNIFVRGSVAVVFVTSTGLATETYAVRIESTGAFSAVNPVDSR